MKRKVKWGLLILLVGAVGLSNPIAQASHHKDKGGGGSAAAAEKAKGPKQKGPKKQGPFVRVSGQVTNSLTTAGIAGAEVTFTAGETTFTTMTDAGGMYSERLPVTVAGPYTIGFAAPDYNSQSTAVVLVKGNPMTLDVALEPVAPVIVTADVGGDAAPDAVLTAMGSYKIMDGSTFIASGWTPTESMAVTIVTPGADTTDVTLPGAGVFKTELVHLLQEPPITNEQLPPNVPPPPGEFVGGLQGDRDQVLAINPFALERAGHIALTYAVETTSGIYSQTVDVQAALPWRVNPGLRDVPINVPVVLHGKDKVPPAPYDWIMMSVPAGSLAALMDADSQNPEFVPDVAGEYQIMENTSGTMLTVYAGTWRGVIVGQDAEGLPVADNACTGCHNPSGFPAADNFTPWSQTGHAERFTTQLNGAFYSPSCFGCHTVGFDLDPAADNDGFDDVGDYAGFLASGLLAATRPQACSALDSDWACMLQEYPDNAQRANIQCENCHGPQNGSSAHTGNPGNGPFPGTPNGSRYSLASDVCATCHGEPLRHARFQQWQLSRHSNYEVAVDEGDSGNCSRCHTVNGFLAWLPALLSPDIGDEQSNVAVTWALDEVHPQTCVTCHDPHMAGTTSGNDTNANTRISVNTPLLAAGFQAFGVGKGAMCMTCHNTRRGLRNDSIDLSAISDPERAPHGGVQADLLMGQNAYFVTVGIRGGHSFVEDTCVTCHMTATPPPDLLAYNQGGANHTFFASRDVCSECHAGGEPNADGVQAAINGPLHVLEGLIIAYYEGLIADLIAAGNTIDVDGALITDPAQIQAIHLSEARGRQALTFDLAGGSVGPARLNNDIDVIGPDAGSLLRFPPTSGPVLGPLRIDERVLKATWNYLLVHTDASGGVHNPAYSSLVLERAIAAMTAP